MTSLHWEFRSDPPASGVTNMRIDDELLRTFEASSRPGTVLRFYSWIRPTLSLGRNQLKERAADLEFCRRCGIDVVHRPTGGRAVLHDDELTYAVVSNQLPAFGGGTVYGTYRRVSEALAEGYRRLGIDVDLAPGRPAERDLRYTDDPCFVSQSRYELAVNGRKLVGSAQRRLRRAFLQHGSMPLSLDRALLARATGFGSMKPLKQEMTSIAECLGRVPGREELIATFARAFETYFDVVLDQPFHQK